MDGSWKKTVVQRRQKPRRIKIITLGDAFVGKSCIVKRYCEKRFVSKYMATIGIDYGVVGWKFERPEGTPPIVPAWARPSRKKSTSAEGGTANAPVQVPLQATSRGDSATSREARTGGSSSNNNNNNNNDTDKNADTSAVGVGVTTTRANSSSGDDDQIEDVRVNLYDMSGAPEFADVRADFYESVQGIVLVCDLTKHESFEHLSDWLEEVKSEAGDDALQHLHVVVCANKADRLERQSAVDRGRPSHVPFEDVEAWAAQHKNVTAFKTSAKQDEGITESLEHLFQSIMLSIHSEAAPEFDDPSQTSAPSHTSYYTSGDAARVSQIVSCASDHAVLGVSKDSSEAEVSKAFKALAGSIHPDKNNAPRSNEAFQRVLAAKDALLQPKK